MRIVFLLSQSLDTPSGLGRYWPVSKELVRLGHSVTILALHHNLDQCSQRRFSREGVDVHYVGQMHVRRQGPRKVYFRPGRLLVNVLASSLKMAYALLRTDAELIQLCKAQPTNSVAARLGRRGRPIYCDCDDYEAEINKFGGKWQQAIVRHFEDGVVRYARGLTVNTRFTQARYGDLGFPMNRIFYVPNGVERSRFAVQFDPALLRQQLGIDVDDPLALEWAPHAAASVIWASTGRSKTAPKGSSAS